MRNRRRSRRGKAMYGRKTKLNFTPVIVILCLSVGCGYAAAKYVVEPVVNYTPEFLTEKPQVGTEDKKTEKREDVSNESGVDDKKTDVLEGEADVKETGQVSGYALQFGCYSSMSSAESAKGGIPEENLQVIKQKNMYKIIGAIYKTKQEATDALSQVDQGTKAFVTTIYK